MTDRQRERLIELPKLLDRAWADHRLELATVAHPRSNEHMDYHLNSLSVDDMTELLRETYHEMKQDGSFEKSNPERIRLERLVGHEMWRAEKRTQQRLLRRQQHLSAGIQSN